MWFKIISGKGFEITLEVHGDVIDLDRGQTRNFFRKINGEKF